MANTVIQNINKLVGAKNELKSILQAIGQNPTDSAATYAALFESALDEMNEKSDDILGE